MSTATTTPLPQRIATRELIIEGTIELINLRGTNIGIRQIVEHTNTSSGSFYYYFNNFSEIVLAIVNQLRSELAEVLKLPLFGPIHPVQAVGYYTGGASLLWRYRSIISAGRELSHLSTELANGFRDLNKEGFMGIRLILENLLEHNPGPTAIDQESRDRLAESLWVLSSAWPRYEDTINEPGQTTPHDIAEGLQQCAFMLVPYVDKNLITQVNDGLKKYISALE
ncbi:MAG: TetR/AcrR family transcriptional regulator [Parvularculales bacterium]